MDILVWIIFIVEAILGVSSCICIIALLFTTIIGKIVKKVKYGKSLYA